MLAVSESVGTMKPLVFRDSMLKGMTAKKHDESPPNRNGIENTLTAVFLADLWPSLLRTDV